MRPRISIRGSVHPSVGPSVCPFLRALHCSCLSWSSRHPSHLHNSIFFMSNSLNKIAFESCISSLLLLNRISFLVLIKQKHVSPYDCCLKQNLLKTFSSLKDSFFLWRKWKLILRAAICKIHFNALLSLVKETQSFLLSEHNIWLVQSAIHTKTQSGRIVARSGLLSSITGVAS